MKESVKKIKLRSLPMQAIYAIIFVVLLVLCSQFPYTGDDWAWGSSVGIERLQTWFDNYSGRYTGNLIVLALTRSNFLKTVTMAFCLTGIIALVNKITGEQKNAVFLICAVLLLMPVTLLRQAVVWTSGFANYTISIFLALIYIYYTRRIYDDELPQYPRWHIAAMLLLGFAGAMVVEHITVYSVLLSIYVVVFVLIKFKKVVPSQLAYLIGTVAGTVTMFSNSVYHSVAAGTDDYRTIDNGESGGLIDDVIIAFNEKIMPEGFVKNLALNVILCIMCFVLWHCVKTKLPVILRIIGDLCLGVITAFDVLSFTVTAFETWDALQTLECNLTVAYILAMGIFLLILPLDKSKKVRLLFYYCSIGCMIAPLFVVTPIGSRCFFAPYVMMLMLAVEIYSNVDERLKVKITKDFRAAALVSAVAAAFLIYVYTTINIANIKRVDKAIDDAQTQSVVYVKELPYNDHVWCGDLKKEVWTERFKLFYGIDNSVEIKQVK